MYNFSFEMTYKNKDNETYQKELLKVFNMETFNQEILMNKISILFSKFNNELKDIFEIIKKRYKFPFEIDDFSCFQILFSWENLETTHLFFQNYFKNKKINKNIISKHLLNI